MEDAARLFGLFGGAFLALVWLTIIILMIGWPLMAFSAMRSLKRMSIQLERMNELLDARLSSDRR